MNDLLKMFYGLLPGKSDERVSRLNVWGLYTNSSLKRLYCDYAFSAYAMYSNIAYILPFLIHKRGWAPFIAAFFMMQVLFVPYLLKILRYPIMVIASLFYMPITGNFRMLGLWFEDIAEIIVVQVEYVTIIPRLLTGIYFLEGVVDRYASSMNRNQSFQLEYVWLLLSPLTLIKSGVQLAVSPLYMLALLFYNYSAIPFFLQLTIKNVYVSLFGPVLFLLEGLKALFEGKQTVPVYSSKPYRIDELVRIAQHTINQLSGLISFDHLSSEMSVGKSGPVA